MFYWYFQYWKFHVLNTCLFLFGFFLKLPIGTYCKYYKENMVETKQNWLTGQINPSALHTSLYINIFSYILRGGGSIFKLKGPRCGFKLSLISRLGLMGQKILKISYSRTPENRPICQLLLCS